jgi:hypothetical protein
VALPTSLADAALETRFGASPQRSAKTGPVWSPQNRPKVKPGTLTPTGALDPVAASGASKTHFGANQDVYRHPMRPLGVR